MPATSPALWSVTVTVNPRDSAQRRYMRSSICAQSCASVPPAPAWMSRNAPRGSISPGNMRDSSSLRTRSSSFAVSLTISENPASSTSASTSVKKLRGVRQAAAKLVEFGDRGFEPRAFSPQCLRLRRRVPDRRDPPSS